MANKSSRKRPKSTRPPGRIHTLLKIDPRSYDRMLTSIRAGAYAWIAAGVIGVDPLTFLRWRKEGENPECDRPAIRQFYLDVIRAEAVARERIEKKVAKHNPEFWLRTGPGKTKQPELQPGWTDPTVKEPLEVNINGRIEHEVDGEVEHQHYLEQQQPVVLGEAFRVLADLGYVQLTKEGKRLLSDPVDAVKVTPSSPEKHKGNGKP